MVMASKSAYEEMRQKRLEENKMRMDQLNINSLAKALHSPKQSPMKKVKRKVTKQPLDASCVRRSARVKDMPTPSYKEIFAEPMGKARPRSYSSGRRDLANRVYASDEDREYATQRAEDLESSLDRDIPSFVKPMLQSHVTGGFWLGLPNHFCKEHLPDNDIYMTLVDEQGDESQTKYLGKKNGLSAGWRGFAIDHELVDGDALVFQLIDPTTFKVYIIRVNEPGDEDK